MAKRKRLTPPQEGYLSPLPGPTPALRPMGALPSVPIAQVAGDSAASAALAELGEVLTSARAEGRLIESLPIAAIDPRHLVRDRLHQDEEEMEALEASIEARGQQTPIEVIALPAVKGGFSHGLISGWRRLTALARLEARHGDGRFARVQARVVAPPDRQAAYVSMVEENEIRANLSLYERARIAMRAWHEEIYPTRKLALQGLFGAVSRSKRSKINSMIPVVEALDGVLRFPTAIPEKLGLDLARALADVPGFRSRVFAALQAPEPQSAEEELARLNALLRDTGARRPAPPPPSAAEVPVEMAPETKSTAPAPRITSLDPDSMARRLRENAVTARYDAAAGRIELTGVGVDAALYAELKDWLKRR